MFFNGKRIFFSPTPQKNKNVRNLHRHHAFVHSVVSDNGSSTHDNVKCLEHHVFGNRHGVFVINMNKFNEELSHWNEYDYVIINDNLEICYNSIMNIMNGEKKGKKFNQNLQEIKSKIEELSK